MKKYENIVILIPAYIPSNELIVLTKNLLKDFSKIVVVDDGSDKEYESVFNDISNDVILLKHIENKGKGAALKTGLKYIYENFKDIYGAITCDADGQHKPTDICKVAETLVQEKNKSCLILGSRNFDKNVPIRSAFGNTITRGVYYLASKIRLRDTQTGLRAFSYDLIQTLLEIPGDRYEYEINMLLVIARRRIEIKEIEIETVYLNQNKSSHFRTIRDSAIIYGNIIKFSLSSFLCFIIDFIALFFFKNLTSGINVNISLLISIICARVISSLINFSLNKNVVFKEKSNLAILKYYILALCILGMNYCLISVFNIILNLSLFLSKILTEILLFIISYTIQKNLIFNKKSKE